MSIHLAEAARAARRDERDRRGEGRAARASAALHAPNLINELIKPSFSAAAEGSNLASVSLAAATTLTAAAPPSAAAAVTPDAARDAHPKSKAGSISAGRIHTSAAGASAADPDAH
mmetsp:Transcript_6488/g.12647  ORF Transcript_6488/g.12647 Transcript_6488/m.12647 type:complete len:116 (-) Transcript_6488:251-598(-)